MTQPVLSQTSLPYCPGCTHSHLHHLLAQEIERQHWQHKIIGVCSSGCSTDMGKYFNLPFVQAPPGKAPAVATGIKRAQPDKLVFTYQGDTDAVGHGLDALMHAAIRGESISIFCLNNLVSAGSGGQMSPTSITGQITASTLLGRSSAKTGKPVQITELVAKIPNVAFAQRIALHEPDFVEQAVRAIREAFHYQENGQGLSFIEVLGICPPYWHTTPLEAHDRLSQKLLKQYPVQVFRRTPLHL